MKYVIKNCDNYTEIDKDWSCRSTIQNRKGCYCCQDCTDCVIKRVIEVCKKEAVINYPKKEKEFITVNGYQAILNMFDIEEINK